MAAIRQVIGAAVYAALQQSPDLLNIKLERSLVRALSLRDTDIVIAVTLGDDVAQELIGKTEWQTELLIHAVTQSEEPDILADQYLTIAHPVVMGFMHERLEGVGMIKIDKPLYANVGGASCVRTAYYLLNYSTSSNSLE